MEIEIDAKVLIAAIAIFLVTIGAAVYNLELSKSEGLSFKVAVPAGAVAGPSIVKGNGQQVSMTPIAIDLTRRGLPKQIFNGDVERIKSGGITNTGDRPVRMRMEMVNSTIPVVWNVKAGLGYDPESHTFSEPLMPGKSVPDLSASWYFSFPGDKRSDPVVYDGGLKFTDADSGELLTFQPIRFMNGNPQPANGSDSTEGACH